MPTPDRPESEAQVPSEGKRWTNAVIELVVALDIDPDAPAELKLEAATDAFEHLLGNMPDEPQAVGMCRFEDVIDGEPIPLATANAEQERLREALGRIENVAATWNGQDRDNLPAVVEHIARLARLGIESAPPREDSDG